MPTYIVVFKDDVTPEQIAYSKKQVTDQQGKIGEDFSTTFKGFEAIYPEGTVSILKADQPYIDGVEFSSEVHIT